MLEKKYLLTIRELKLQGVLSDISDSEYGSYCELLDNFIDSFPAQDTALKECFKAGDNKKFMEILSEIKQTLTQIRAEDLAAKCDMLSESTTNPNHDMAEASLSYFLTSVSMLSIELQMAKHKKDTPESENDITEVIEEVREQKNILAVDDVSLLLSTLRAMLFGADYKFTGVTSGEAALRFLVNHKVDLFLLDIEMPDMNGYELAQKIRDNGHTAPIIFLTGNSKKEYVIKAMQVGAADFIVKPVNKEQVLEKIKKHVG